MRHFIGLMMLLSALLLSSEAFAQDSGQTLTRHKVKKSETVFGIAKKYGVTITDLIKANPVMNTPGYELKKGDYVVIPLVRNVKVASQPVASPVKTVKVGIALPLHNIDGDGRRMLEYYRGMLMACQDMKKEGVSVDVYAWNLAIDDDANTLLSKPEMSKCDVIFGPLYTKQVKTLADYARNNGKRLVIPFSISAFDVLTNPSVFQVYQSNESFYNDVISHFAYRYGGYNVVVIDCNDKTSDKGIFTFPLRKTLEERNISCNVTNIDSGQEIFVRAFSLNKPNVVVLNTSRSPELNRVISKLDNLLLSCPQLKVSLFGYTEWLMYEKYDKDKFFKYDTCIPASAYYNSYSSKIKELEGRYNGWFKSDMMDYLPRFAVTGYDHAMFFIKGIYDEGNKFNGSVQNKGFLQNNLCFKRASAAGGYQNKGLMFVHYNVNKSISLINLSK
ncbi:MAG: LysM peptidoglycan-binding domain-containing protein [Prevotella sp.]